MSNAKGEEKFGAKTTLVQGTFSVRTAFFNTKVSLAYPPPKGKVPPLVHRQVGQTEILRTIFDENFALKFIKAV